MYNLYGKIELLCKERNIKTSDLANALGLNKSMFCDLRTGRKNTLSLEKLILIADYFEISLDELVGRKKRTPAEESAEVMEIMELIKGMTSEQQALFLNLAEQLILRDSTK